VIELYMHFHSNTSKWFQKNHCLYCTHEFSNFLDFQFQ
jgi:hypothetical protein